MNETYTEDLNKAYKTLGISNNEENNPINAQEIQDHYIRQITINLRTNTGGSITQYNQLENARNLLLAECYIPDVINMIDDKINELNKKPSSSSKETIETLQNIKNKLNQRDKLSEDEVKLISNIDFSKSPIINFINNILKIFNMNNIIGFENDKVQRTLDGGEFNKTISNRY